MFLQVILRMSLAAEDAPCRGLESEQSKALVPACSSRVPQPQIDHHGILLDRISSRALLHEVALVVTMG